jgi:hypothetical protein
MISALSTFTTSGISPCRDEDENRELMRMKKYYKDMTNDNIPCAHEPNVPG